jgi:GT2 family glycosyltransferase/tetratricopeptide (TPR) repeat protein
MWRKSSPQARFAAVVERADRARDEGRFAAASKAYAAALLLSPDRNDLRVQMANMLKDSGEFAAAELAYLAALKVEPRNADINLQLGRLLGLTGKRGGALAAYRRALELDPRLAAAYRELAAAGDAPAQMVAFEMQMREGGTEALLNIRAKLDGIAGQMAEIRARLPDALASAAFPIDAYAEFRRVFDVPAPSGQPSSKAILVVLLADREPLAGIYALMFAIMDQAHPNWSLLVLGSEADRRALVEREAAADPRIAWRDVPASACLGSVELDVARQSEADWVLLLSPGARAHKQALAWIAQTASQTSCDAIVFDEEVGDAGADGATRPILRHTVDADTIREANVYGETIAISAAVLRRLEISSVSGSVSEARSQLLLKLIGAHQVAHVPLPLFRIAYEQYRPPEAVIEAHRSAVSSQLASSQHLAIGKSPWSEVVLQVRTGPISPDVALAVIVQSKNNFEDLAPFVESLISLARRPGRIELLILNNGASFPAGLFDLVKARGCVTQVHEISEPFNWSRFNNIGVGLTKAPYLLFANDDMLMLTEHWDEIVRSLLEREGVGAVGARLLYPDRTVQHAGILFDWRGGAIHDGLHRNSDEGGPALRWLTTRSVSAVTGAFLATRRADFAMVGGFDETHLPVSYGDVDYALRLRALGRHIVWTPMITAYHHESKSRGLDHLEAAKSAREGAERAVVRARWPGELDREPSLNPVWHQGTLPHRLLNFPSTSRIWSYIVTSAKRNPWATVT